MNSAFNQTGLDQATLQGLVQVFTATGTTLSLTTTAGQKVIVWAKGHVQPSGTGGGAYDVNLKYDGVVKDKITVDAASSTAARFETFALQYTETPGAGTANITVDGGENRANVVITVLVIG
jgi:hypothetical protein